MTLSRLYYPYAFGESPVKLFNGGKKEYNHFDFFSITEHQRAEQSYITKTKSYDFLKISTNLIKNRSSTLEENAVLTV